MEVNHAPGSLHYGDFVQANSKMAASTAGQLESALRVNKASAKALLNQEFVFYLS